MNSSFLVILFGRVLQLFYSYLSVKGLTNFLPVEETAKYYLAISVINLFSMIFVSPFGSYLTSKTNVLKDSCRLMDAFKSLSIYLSIVVVVCVPLVFSYLYFGDGKYFDNGLALLVFLDILVATMCSSMVATFNMLFKRVRFVLYTNAILFTGLAISTFLVLYTEDSYFFWILGALISKLIFLYIVLFDLKKVVAERSKHDFFNFFRYFSIEGLVFALPLILSAFAVWSQSNAYRFFLAEYLNLNAVAMVSLGFSIAINLNLALESIINQIVLPVLYKEGYDKNNNGAKIFSLLVPAYISFSIFVFSFSEAIVNIFSNDQYLEASYYLMWGVLIEFFRTITRLFSNYLYIVSDTKSVLNSSLAGAVVMIGGLFFSVDLVTKYSSTVSIIALTSSIFSLIFVLYVIINKYNIRVDILPSIYVFIGSSPVFLFSTLERSGFILTIASMFIGSICILVSHWLFNRKVFELLLASR